MGIVNGFSAITGTMVPPLTAMVLGSDPSDPFRWRAVFYSGVILYCLAFTSFCFFGKFEPQKFNNIGYEFKALQDTEDEEDEMNEFDPHQGSGNSHRTTSQNGQPWL